jgi:ribosome-binding protein aMBF1 (putative translation factor)
MKNKHLTSLDTILDKEYGKRGTKRREAYEREFEAFKLGVMIKQAREELHLSQSELAEKADTNKSYISRIENDASDIRLSTLMKIVEKGLGGKLRISVEL